MASEAGTLRDKTPRATDGTPLRVAIVGYGSVGERRAAVIHASEGVELSSVSDVRPECHARLPEGVRFDTDYKKIISDDIDVVFVAAYNAFAPDIVCAALAAGKHVFCEKPPGRNVADVERIRAAALKRPDLKLKFGFNHRYHYSVMEARAMIESGELGKVLWARGVYGKAGGLAFRENWRNDPAMSGGGILLDQGIHMVDLFRYLCGEFDTVQSHVSNRFWDIAPLEDNAFAILSNREGQVALLHSSATQWKHKFNLEICMSGGYINLNGILSSTRSYGEETLTFARREFEDQTAAIGKPREQTIYFDHDDSWRLELEDFFRAIRTGAPVATCGIDDAMETMKLVSLIYERNANSSPGG